jgi:chemotaxis protein MotB
MIQEEPEQPKAGMPPWVMTFADLMSLLMCFFVLLLSFAEIDAIKFKQIAKELEKAFGVQREVVATEVPMGTTPIFDKFSPGVPRPTAVDSVRQETSQEAPNLRTFTSDGPGAQQVREAVEQEVVKSVEQLVQALESEVAAGMLQIEQGTRRIVIRIEEKGSFSSGSADLAPAFEVMVRRIGASLEQIPGTVAVEGHTDDVPISTARFRSNWDLSAARASSVANALLASQFVDPARLRVHGFADTRPRATDSSAASRALNRRVEIVVDLAERLEAFETRVHDLTNRGRED